jgi:hypothetical protein
MEGARGGACRRGKRWQAESKRGKNDIMSSYITHHTISNTCWKGPNEKPVKSSRVHLRIASIVRIVSVVSIESIVSIVSV